MTTLAGTAAYASTSAAGPIEAALLELRRRDNWLNENTGERLLTDAEVDWRDEPLHAPEIDQTPASPREMAALTILLAEVLVHEVWDLDDMIANAYATLGLSTRGA